MRRTRSSLNTRPDEFQFVYGDVTMPELRQRVIEVFPA